MLKGKLVAQTMYGGRGNDYSGGMARRAPGETRMAEILRRADGASYQAKAMGRARTVDAAALCHERLMAV